MKLPGDRFVLQKGEASAPAALLLILILAISWVLWSGIYKPLVLSLGAFSCLLSAFMAQRMGVFRHKSLFGFLPRLPAYWWQLLGDIVVSSIDVAKLILQPSMPISPTVVVLESASETEAGQVILGNSITLSPGTVTVDVHQGKLLVHCLTAESARDLQQGEANQRAARLERG